MINNGIISYGNNNKNTINYTLLVEYQKELTVLIKNVPKESPDYEKLLLATTYCKKNNITKFKNIMKTLSKKVLDLIIDLGLVALEHLIEELLIK